MTHPNGRRTLLAIAFSALALAGCSTTPDPAKICTAEWIEPRAERALDRLESRTAKAFRNIRRAASAYVAGDEPGTLTLLSLRGSLRDLEREIKDGQGVRDLRLLARTCDDPDFIAEKMTEFLDRQNLPDGVVRFMDEFGIVDRIVEWAEARDERDA